MTVEKMTEIKKRLKRLTEIIFVFIIFFWRAFIRLKGNEKATEEKRAILLRKTLEKLGSVFIKFGQLLSLRPDFLPIFYCQELFFLLENVPPFSYDEVVKTFQKEFSSRPDSLFKTFIKKPVAAASFGQVHEAYLKTGEKVAIKIQRPQIKEIVERDIGLMKLIAKIVDLFPFGPNKLSPLIKEFENWTKEELDYLVEANYTDEFYQKTKNSIDSITAPSVYKNFCSQKILTAQYIEGITISSILLALKNNDHIILKNLKQMGFSKEKIAIKILKGSIKQIYIDGFFHADPHPANIIFTKNKGLVYIDFGIVGKLTRKERIACLRYVRSVLYEDTENSFDALIHLCDISKVTDLNSFKKEHDKIVKKTLKLFNEGKIKGTSQIIGKKLMETLKILQKYQAVVPPNTLRYFRTVATIESIVLSLSPNLELNSMANKFRNISIVNLIKELPEFLTTETLNESIIRWVNFVEKEMLNQ